MSKYILKCINCGKQFSPDDIKYLCPTCAKSNSPTLPPKGVLKVVYPYQKIVSKYGNKNLFNKIKKNNYLDLLPVNSNDSFSFLKVGDTPLYKINHINGEKINFNLLIKDDSQNPTFSFKDRASNLVSAYAKENKIDTIVTASTGNAGSSLAGICASQKQKAIIIVPASAPKAKLTQIVMYGAKVIPVDGTYDNAFDLSIEATKHFGWYNRNTAFNPYTIEGKKSVAYELYIQNSYKIPDRIFIPVGDGVIISGVYKGFEDLLMLSIIDKMPTIIAVQAKGSSNIINNMEKSSFSSKPSTTIADSISVDIPRNFYMAKNYLKNYNGEWISVSDDEIMIASKQLSSNYGLFSEPAASAAFAGLLKYMWENKINNNSSNVVLLTGNGLKDLNSVQKIIDIPKPIKPNLDSLISLF